MRTTKDVQLDVDRLVAGLLTTAEVARLFKRSIMMIHNYRTREHDPLPVVLILGRARYVRHDVIAWARRNDIHVYQLGEMR